MTTVTHSPAWRIVITLAFDGVAGLAGGLVSERVLQRYATALVGFAAGALLAAGFLDALPEAFERFGGAASVWAFGGFVGAVVLEWWLGTHDHEHADTRATVPTVLLASDGVHNTVDGAAIAAAWMLSTRAGLATAIAVIAHELPQEIGDFALLRRFGYSRRRALAALFAVQLTAVLGAVAAILAASAATQVAARIVAIASGSFLYIGAADLLPELRGEVGAHRRQRGVGFAAGVVVVVAAGLFG